MDSPFSDEMPYRFDGAVVDPQHYVMLTFWGHDIYDVLQFQAKQKNIFLIFFFGGRWDFATMKAQRTRSIAKPLPSSSIEYDDVFML